MSNITKNWKNYILKEEVSTFPSSAPQKPQATSGDSQKQQQIADLNQQIQALQTSIENHKKQSKLQIKDLENLKNKLSDLRGMNVQQSQQLELPLGEVKAGNTNIAGSTAEGSPQVPGDFPDKPNKQVKDLATVQEEELTEEELEEACGEHEGLEEGGKPCKLELQYEEVEEQKQCNECRDCTMCGLLTEAKYKGRKVTLNKPMRGDVKKFKVFVRDPSTGNIKKVNFGDKKMRIKKSNPKRRKSFRARHRCANPGPKTKARYWSCRKW